MLAVGIFFMGQFALFTYLRPLLETVTLVNVTTLTFILLIIGVAGVIGTAVIGKFLVTPRPAAGCCSRPTHPPYPTPPKYTRK